MGGGGKGGSQTTVTEAKLPPWMEREARKNLNIANEVASLGYIPNNVPSVAALSPQQVNAMAGTNSAAQAYGLPSVDTGGMSGDALVSALTGLPAPTDAGGGIMGYSGAGIYEKYKEMLPQAQRDFIDSFFIDPETGIGPLNPVVPRPQYKAFKSPEWNRENARNLLSERRKRQTARLNGPDDGSAPDPYTPTYPWDDITQGPKR